MEVKKAREMHPLRASPPRRQHIDLALEQAPKLAALPGECRGTLGEELCDRRPGGKAGQLRFQSGDPPPTLVRRSYAAALEHPRERPGELRKGRVVCTVDAANCAPHAEG